jgi:hypothetical protein
MSAIGFIVQVGNCRRVDTVSGLSRDPFCRNRIPESCQREHCEAGNSVRNVPEHLGGKSAALCLKCQSPVHKGICDLCHMPVGGMTLTVSAPTAHSVTVTSALTYVLLPTGACGFFVHPV